jgi:16S rRNA (uracil1498-N3)-methyltransferase
VSVTLVQGVSSADRMDLTVRKAVELGVSRILPIFTQRSVVKLDGNRVDRRRAHWQGIAISACEQCGRNLVPEVEEPVGFETWLAALPREPQDGESRVFLSVDGAIRLRELPAPTGPMLLLAGPEGGFAPSEADLVMTRAFTPVRLGPRVLRTETAAIAAISAIQTLWGDF